jgi:hypothetical protein
VQARFGEGRLETDWLRNYQECILASQKHSTAPRSPPTLLIPRRSVTPDHQRAIQKHVQQMHKLTGKPYGTIYESLKTAFGVPKYADIPDQDWPRVVQWFRAQ